MSRLAREVQWSTDDEETVSLFVDNALFVLHELQYVANDTFESPLDAIYEVELPDAFRLEVIALFYLVVWELTGLTATMRLKLPPIQVAIDELRTRVVGDTESFFDRTYVPELFECVAELASRLQMTATEFDAQFLVAEVDADVLVESIARILWAARQPAATQTQRPTDQGSNS